MPAVYIADFTLFLPSEPAKQLQLECIVSELSESGPNLHLRPDVGSRLPNVLCHGRTFLRHIQSREFE